MDLEGQEVGQEVDLEVDLEGLEDLVHSYPLLPSQSVGCLL